MRKASCPTLERPWSRGAVHQILINDKYAGHNVWGRTSFKLKTKHVRNDPSDWIRHDQAFPAIVSQDVFDAARRIIEQRSQRLSDDEMLALAVRHSRKRTATCPAL
jgi:hypothetical protein